MDCKICEKNGMDKFVKEWLEFLRREKPKMTPLERDLYGITAMERLERRPNNPTRK